MARFKLNDEALDDIENIFDYGIDTHGLEAAIIYIEGLTRRFAEIALHPLQSQAVDNIREGYRRNVYCSHSIYYRVDEGGVEIMAIVGKQNIETRGF